jgi:hypothetical protein
MDANYLRQLGFDLSTGLVFRNNKCWGSFNAHGITMSPEGMELVERLEAGDDPAAPAPKAELPVPATKAAKAPKAKKAEAPADPAPDDLNSALSGLGDLLNADK